MQISQLNRAQFHHLDRLIRCHNTMRSATDASGIARMLRESSDSYEVVKLLDPSMDLLYDEIRCRNRSKAKLTERQERIILIRGKTSGPVYYINSGCDCDGCEYQSSYEFDNQFEADEYIDSAYDGADGPMHWSKCTKEEYNEHESYTRDLYAEQAGY